MLKIIYYNEIPKCNGHQVIPDNKQTFSFFDIIHNDVKKEVMLSVLKT